MIYNLSTQRDEAGGLSELQGQPSYSARQRKRKWRQQRQIINVIVVPCSEGRQNGARARRPISVDTILAPERNPILGRWMGQCKEHRGQRTQCRRKGAFHDQLFGQLREFQHVSGGIDFRQKQGEPRNGVRWGVAQRTQIQLRGGSEFGGNVVNKVQYGMK